MRLLLSTFCLIDVVDCPFLVHPQISNKREKFLSFIGLQQRSQHRPSKNQVESVDAVCRHDCGAGVQIRQSLKGVGDALCACSCGHRVLKRESCALHNRTDLLCDCA